MTLGEWIPAFIDAYKRDTIRPDSLYTVQLVASKIPWEILAMELNEIRPMHLQRFVNAFALTASKSYMDKLHVLLNGLFVAAIDNDLCAKNPAARVKYPRIREQPREAFTMEEVCAILDFAMHYDRQRIAVGIMVLLLTGIRRGELLGLKESDITDRSLTVNRAVYLVHNHPCVTEHEAKTEHSLRWPIGSSVCPIRENFCSVQRTARFFIPGILPGTMMHSFASCGKRCPLCVTCPPTAAATPSPP